LSSGVVLLALLAALGACSRPSRPVWIELAPRAEAPRLVAPGEHVLPDGKSVRLVDGDGGTRLEMTLASSDWEEQSPPSFWIARPQLLMTGGGRTSGAEFRLTAGERAFAPAPRWKGEKGFPTDSFFAEMGSLVVRLPKDERPPEGMRFSILLHTGQGPSWGRRFSGRKLDVWPGEELRVRADVPEGSALRFATILEPMLGEGTTAPVTWSVLLDGEPLFSDGADAKRTLARWHAVPLPKTGPVELTFRVSGPLAVTGFLAPVIGPLEIGSRGARPWDERRPDVLVFLADTFRADNLAAYGGELGLAPEIDALAAESRLFRRAWSVGTFTLPSHVSLFTGVLPFQAGLQTMQNSLHEDLDTIAELLSAAGYRTGAVTDAGIVSQRFGFDQGFDAFDEEQTTIESTVERALAFLDADDGRPTFLFVQSYRAHAPYHVSDETRREHGARLEMGPGYDDLMARLEELARASELPPVDGVYPPALVRMEAAAPLIAGLRALYRGGVIDLDRGFGRFRRELEGRRWFDHGLLIFTSDHGEAFAEHGELEHGERVFESKVRVPLFLHGTGIQPGVVHESASLVDLSPTIARAAGLPALPIWVGTSLLDLPADRPVLSFGFDGDHTFSVVDGDRKAIGFQTKGTVDSGRMVGGFDLARDPGELEDLRARGEAWPEEMLRHYRARVEEALQPLVHSQQQAVLDARDLEELGKLGYGNQ